MPRRGPNCKRQTVADGGCSSTSHGARGVRTAYCKKVNLSIKNGIVLSLSALGSRRRAIKHYLTEWHIHTFQSDRCFGLAQEVPTIKRDLLLAADKRKQERVEACARRCLSVPPNRMVHCFFTLPYRRFLV